VTKRIKMLQFVSVATGQRCEESEKSEDGIRWMQTPLPAIGRHLSHLCTQRMYVMFAFVKLSPFRQSTAIKMGLLIADILRVSAQFWMFSMHAAAMLFMCCSQVIFAGTFRLCDCAQSLPSLPERHYRRSPRAFCAAVASREPRPTGG
jgi:hypothetical protein